MSSFSGEMCKKNRLYIRRWGEDGVVGPLYVLIPASSLRRYDTVILINFLYTNVHSVDGPGPV